MYKLFLDDIREPYSPDFIIARSTDQAIQIIQEKGFPYFFSLDHDLGDNTLTGLDFVKWVIEYDLDNNVIPDDFTFNIHSANPPGAENMKSLLESYLSFKKKNS